MHLFYLTLLAVASASSSSTGATGPVDVSSSTGDVSSSSTGTVETSSSTGSASSTGSPTAVPTGTASGAPTGTTSGAPTGTTSVPTTTPTEAPTSVPTTTPTDTPTVTPTGTPTELPTISPGDQSATMCTCLDNTEGGHWLTDPSGLYTPCLLCQPGWSGIGCNVRACTATQCGNGVCNTAGPGCICNVGWQGANCDVCAEARWGQTCNFPYDCTAASCNSQGVCQALDKLVTGCGNTFFDPAAGEMCCPYVTAGQYRAGEWVYPGEYSQYNVASLGETCCGPSVCAYEETCVNEELGVCCADVEEVCSLEHENGTSSATRSADVQCCARGSKCCNGDCCDAFEACVTLPPPATGWKDALGEKIEKVKVCSATSAGMITGAAVARVFILPVGCALGGLLTLLAICKADVSGGMKATGSLAVVTGILLCASQWWTRGLLAIFGVFLTMIFSGPEWSRWPRFTAIAVQTAVLLVIAVFPDLHVFPGTVNRPSPTGPWAQMDLNTMLDGCRSYFGYFYRANNLKPWNAHPTYGNYFGFCSITWQTIELAVVAVLVCALILFVVTTLVNLLESPEPVPKLSDAGDTYGDTGGGGGPPPVEGGGGGPPPSGGTGDEVEMQSQPVGHTVNRDEAGIFQVQQQ